MADFPLDDTTLVLLASACEIIQALVSEVLRLRGVQINA